MCGVANFFSIDRGGLSRPPGGPSTSVSGLWQLSNGARSFSEDGRFRGLSTRLEGAVLQKNGG